MQSLPATTHPEPPAHHACCVWRKLNLKTVHVHGRCAQNQSEYISSRCKLCCMAMCATICHDAGMI